MAINLSNQHPDYAATAGARRKSRDLYEGGDAVKARGTAYLYREKNETDDDYALRLKRAVLDPYVGKIIGARQALLFQKPVERTLPTRLAGWVEDVDRKGTRADTFFAEAARDAQVDGVHWVLVDMPRLEAPYPSAQFERQAGHRPFFEHVPGDAVIDWEVGPDQALLWAVIAQQTAALRPLAGLAGKAVTQWKVWTRTTWHLFEAKGQDGGQGTGYTLVAEGAHPLRAVPLVPFLGVRNTDFSGWPVCRSVLDHVLQIYNKESDLDWFERLTAHPIPYVVSPRKPDKLDTSQGFWVQSDASGAPIQLGYLEPSTAGFDSIRTSIESLQARVLRIALAQARKETAQVQSGESQREDRKIFAASLHSASVHYEAQEQRCWQLMAAWETGGTLARAPRDIDVIYNRDFDDSWITHEMIRAFSELVGAGVITKRTLLQILRDGDVMPDGFDIEAELEAVGQAEAEAARELVRGLRAEETGAAF